MPNFNLAKIQFIDRNLLKIVCHSAFHSMISQTKIDILLFVKIYIILEENHIGNSNFNHCTRILALFQTKISYPENGGLSILETLVCEFEVVKLYIDALH